MNIQVKLNLQEIDSTGSFSISKWLTNNSKSLSMLGFSQSLAFIVQADFLMLNNASLISKNRH